MATSVYNTAINMGYDVNRVSDIAASKATSNWEWGTHAQALLELHDPDISVSARMHS